MALRALQLHILPRPAAKPHHDRVAEAIEAVISQSGLGMLRANPGGFAT
jgi:hypothetical protein